MTKSFNVFTVQVPITEEKKSSKKTKIGKDNFLSRSPQSEAQSDFKSYEYPRKAWSYIQKKLIVPSSEHGLHALLIMLIMTTSSFAVTLLPAHNVLTSPEYWYELIFSNSQAALLFSCATVVEMNDLLSNCFKKRKMMAILQLFLAKAGSQGLLICLLHLIWTDIFGYYEPFPHRNAITGHISNAIFVTQAWYIIPKAMRMDPTFKNRCIAFLRHGFWAITVPVQLALVNLAMLKVSPDYQWMVALLFPVTKEMNDRCLGWSITKSVSREKVVKAKFIAKILMNVTYSFWLAIMLASTATKATEYTLLGINFCIDMALCFKVIRLDKKVSGLISDTSKERSLKREIMTELILNEFLEVVVPIAFIVSFSIAYHGPNKDILGGVGCSIWHYKRVEDLYAFLMPVAEMALIDAVSVVLAGIALWLFCRINICQEYCIVVNKYWIYLALWGGTIIGTVSITINNSKEMVYFNDND